MGDVKAAIEAKILEVVGASENGIPSSYAFAQENGFKHPQVVGVLQSLQADEFVNSEVLEQSWFELTKEAQGYASGGSPEYLLLQQIPTGSSLAISDAMKLPGGKLGMSKCMENKWVKKEGGSIVRVADEVEDELQQKLKALSLNPATDTLPESDVKVLKKRKLVKLVTEKVFRAVKGSKYAAKRVKAVADFTKEMLDDGSWKDVELKPVNFSSTGAPVVAGYLHPLMKVRLEFRKILIGMGFEEMPTNQWVESSFWNFDSLFQPQQHPARDAHDTFFLSNPEFASLDTVKPEYKEIVQKTHEEGGWGSIGYRYDWSMTEAKKNILRTHTTAVSAQMLYKLANQEGGFKPQKYFSIDRVFRNEKVDATHLAEFHQVEGLVADYDLSLGDLIGVIETFFKSLGIEKLRFKPAYNPYTEPSMEIFGFHPDLNKWTEIGNSGMFRPEMLRPMGLPEGVRVIAWGLSLERPTMIKYRISKITELFGHRVKLEAYQANPVARFP